MSTSNDSQSHEMTFGYGVAWGTVLGVAFGIWTKDLLGSLTIATAISLLFSYIWNN